MKIRLNTVTFIHSFKNYSKSASVSSGLYILSAVRTPIALSKGVLNEFTAPWLVSFVCKEALQRAIVPAENIQNVYLGSFSHSNCKEEILKRTGLSKGVQISCDSTCGIKSLIKGASLLLTGNQTVCLTGGMVSMSSSIEQGSKETLKDILSNQRHSLEFIKLDYNKFINASKNGAFLDEIAAVSFRKKGQEIIVTEDELYGSNTNFSSINEGKTEFVHSPRPADGAVAFVIATENYVQENHLMPIAEIISFTEESVKFNDFSSAQLHVIEEALKVGNCQQKQITQWEIDCTLSDAYSTFINHFNVNSAVVNKDGGAHTLGYPIGLSGAKALCHLSHSLLFEEWGCASSCDYNGTVSAVVIKKCRGHFSTPPVVTLFTKKPCPLCDELKDQLKPFEGRFSLKEVDIEAEENRKYYELYKFEIPVLFLERRFLCKHKLDAEHFNRRLLDFENLTG